MTKGEYLGDFEQLILLALLRLRDGAYGMAMRREIERRTGRVAAIGAVYATLDRLEAKGLVSSRFGEPTPERGGRAKRTFNITVDGRRALQQSQQSIRRMMAGLRLEVAPK